MKLKKKRKNKLKCTTYFNFLNGTIKLLKKISYTYELMNFQILNDPLKIVNLNLKI